MDYQPADDYECEYMTTAWYTLSEFPQWVQTFVVKMTPGGTQQITGTLNVTKGQGNQVGLQTWVVGAVPAISDVPTEYPAASGPILFYPKT